MSSLLLGLVLTFLCGPVDAAGATDLRLDLLKVPTEHLYKPRHRTREIVVETEAEHVCPDNYEKSGNGCVKIETAPAQRTCLPGWQRGSDAAVCVGYSVAAPDHTCTKGSPQYSKCLIENSTPKQLLCRDGYSLDLSRNGNCVRDVSSTPIKLCPPGSLFEKDRCVTTTKVAASLTCPTGYDFNGQRCDKIIQAPLEFTCTEGYLLHPIKRKCLKEVVTPAATLCPPGYTQRGPQCIAEDSLPVNVKCSNPAAELVGNMCVSYDRTTPLFRCPPSLRLNPLSHYCEGDEVADPIPECTKGTYYNPATGQCGSPFKVKQPNLACPPDFHFAGKRTCVKHIQEPGIKDCPQDYTFEGKDSCVKRLQTPARIDCPPGSTQRGNFCVSTRYDQPFQECPPETVLTPAGCVSIAYGPLKTACPPGFFGGNDKERLCVKKDTLPPTPKCPPKTVMVDGFDMRYCIGQEEVSHTKHCPPGHRQTDEECLETVTEPAEEACPPGYHEDLESGRCFSVETLPSHPICPAGFKMMGDKCLKQHVRAAEIVCPPGYERSGPMECAKKNVVPLIHQCAFGFEYDSLKGVCSATKVKYEFDHPQAPEEESTTEPEEALKDIEVTTPKPTTKAVRVSATHATTTTTTTEPSIEVQVTKPVVQKGLVVRNEVITLSGPASQVAKKQQLLSQGTAVKDLGDNMKVEYTAA